MTLRNIEWKKQMQKSTESDAKLFIHRSQAEAMCVMDTVFICVGIGVMEGDGGWWCFVVWSASDFMVNTFVKTHKTAHKIQVFYYI